MLARIVAALVIAALAAASVFAQEGLEQGIPLQHPVTFALRYRNEISLSQDQVASLERLRGAFARDFAPFREKMGAIQRRMGEIQRGGNPDPNEVQKLEVAAGELENAIRPLADGYAQQAMQLLRPEQQQKLARLAEAAPGKDGEGKDFPLVLMMQERARLGITPQQFTKLQFLQADFIRAFAPLREQMEMIQIELRGKPPTPEIAQRVEALVKQIKELQATFSERAARDVLTTDQRARLGDLLRDKRN